MHLCACVLKAVHLVLVLYLYCCYASVIDLCSCASTLPGPYDPFTYSLTHGIAQQLHRNIKGTNSGNTTVGEYEEKKAGLLDQV